MGILRFRRVPDCSSVPGTRVPGTASTVPGGSREHETSSSTWYSSSSAVVEIVVRGTVVKQIIII